MEVRGWDRGLVSLQRNCRSGPPGPLIPRACGSSDSWKPEEQPEPRLQFVGCDGSACRLKVFCAPGDRHVCGSTAGVQCCDERGSGVADENVTAATGQLYDEFLLDQRVSRLTYRTVVGEIG